MIEYYLQALRNFGDFRSRSRRSEYWYFTLVNVIVTIVFVFVDTAMGTMADAGFGLFSGLYSLLIVVPSLAVAVRRLHDTGRSGWNLLWSLLPLIGGIILLVFYCQDSQPGHNDWGPNPKGFNEDIIDEIEQENTF